ncbi:hypothetical protein ACFQGX_24950 [Nonomuraea dietziae]|uniref:hypothetical protein n=1 Tax=Nonomuraea dietziae TaxID=65515 RepID=UPI00336D6C71
MAISASAWYSGPPGAMAALARHSSTLSPKGKPVSTYSGRTTSRRSGPIQALAAAVWAAIEPIAARMSARGSAAPFTAWVRTCRASAR